MRERRGGWLAVLAALWGCSGAPPTGTPDPAATLQLIAGGNQSQIAGYLLPDTIVVRLVDRTGQPMAFAPIDAVVDATDEAPFATVTSVDGRTRADGTARFIWRLGLALGGQTLRITTGASSAIAPLAVSATATSQRVRALAGSDRGLCAIDLAGQLGCWTPLADPDHPPRFMLQPTDVRFSALAIYPLADEGQRGCAAATTGRIWCFDLGGSTVSNLAELPGAYPSLGGITTGGNDLGDDPPFCALAQDGAAWCWGSNATGALGDGTTTDRDVPAPVATATRFTRLAVGSRHACGLGGSGSIWCWGSNHSAQVGIEAGTTAITTPRRIAELVTFADVAVVSDHATCGVGIGGGGAWCWGRKTDLGIGQAAMNLIEGQATPRAIYLADLASPLAIGRVDDAVIAIGPPAGGSWWGDLSAFADQVVAVAPRPFVKTVGFRTLAMPASSGVACGATDGPGDAMLCARLPAVSGYPSHAASPALAGFGVPFP